MSRYFSFVFFAIIIGVVNTPMSKHNTAVISRYQQAKDSTKKASTNKYIAPIKLPDKFNLDIWAMAQNNRHEMFFATRKGVLHYDGLSWEMIPIGDIPLNIVNNQNLNIIFVGGHSNFGYISFSDTIGYKYYSLSKTLNVSKPITQTLQTDNSIFFYSKNRIYQLKTDNLDEISSLNLPNNKSFAGNFIFKQKLFLLSDENKIYSIENNQLRETNISTQAIEGTEILFYTPKSKDEIIVGTSNNKLYVFDGKNFSSFTTNIDEYIKRSGIQKAVNMNAESFAISTTSGGAIILSKQTGQLEFAINYNTGLPDDEIYGMFFDADQGLWLSHQFGLNRAALYSPISDFSNYPGLEGRIIAVNIYDSVPYLATSSGVYYLKKITSKKEVSRIIRKQIKHTSETTGQASENKKEEAEESSNFFKRFFKRKKSNEEANNTSTLKDTLIVITEEVPNEAPRYQSSQELLELLPLTYAYSPVKGINEKARQIVKMNNTLLASTNDGVFEIDGDKAVQILKKHHVYQMEVLEKLNLLFLATNKGLVVLKHENDKWQQKYICSKFGTTYSVALKNDSTIWLGLESMVAKIRLSNGEFKPSNIPERFDVTIPEKLKVRNIKGNIYFFMTESVYKLNANDKIEKTNIIQGISITDADFLFSSDNAVWLLDSKGKKNISDTLLHFNQLRYLNLFDNIHDFASDDQHNIWFANDENNLVCISSDAKSTKNSDFAVYISEIKSMDGKLLDSENIQLDYENNSLKISISAPFFAKNDAIEFQYFISGFSRTWSAWQTSKNINIDMLTPGKHELRVRARNILGQLHESTLLRFRITPPWWQKPEIIGFLILVVLCVLALFIYWIIKRNQAALVKKNLILEQKVKERTEQLEKKNKEITDSINYASYIQSAVLPPVNQIEDYLSDIFILNRPRDIVSGDFYWMAQKNNKAVIVAADCTGHGVPGAFMSMLGVSFLNEIVNQKGILNASDILEQLRQSVIRSLHQTGKEHEQKDGMDLSLVIFDKAKMQIEYAGAYNSIFLISDKKVTESKASRMPIGIHQNVGKPFENQIIPVKKNDLIYMFSDGFMDQFGGPSGRKYLKKRFRETLMEIHAHDLKQQEHLLEEKFLAWKGENHQIDDVLVIGLKI